tara:strand:- start:321 stop:932 length:612 start_codon:yes stop_codon:yes gene_type:complete
MENPNAIAKGAEEHLFERATPGQSLTKDPDSRYPWESPPEMTSVRVASERIFMDLLKDENLETVTNLMAQKTPVADIATLLLTTGFQKGKFNPDLMVSLLEPTMYMLMALAEKAGIDPVISRGDEVVVNDESDPRDKDIVRNNIGDGGRFKDAVVRKISSSSVTPNIKEQLENLDGEKMRQSILQKRKPELQKNPTLLGKTGV